VVLKKYWDLAAFYIAWLLIVFAPEIVAKTTLSYRNLIGMAFIFFAFYLLRVGSRFRTSLKKFSSHSDPDVAALVDGRIDIAEYRKRKEDREKMQ